MEVDNKFQVTNFCWYCHRPLFLIDHPSDPTNSSLNEGAVLIPIDYTGIVIEINQDQYSTIKKLCNCDRYIHIEHSNQLVNYKCVDCEKSYQSNVQLEEIPIGGIGNFSDYSFKLGSMRDFPSKIRSKLTKKKVITYTCIGILILFILAVIIYCVFWVKPTNSET